MSRSAEFLKPLRWSDASSPEFDGLLLPGGHAPGMREDLESSILQTLVAEFFAAEKPVGAICHGVVLAARSKVKKNVGDAPPSVLFGRKTTALLAIQELLAWGLTCAWLGDYYRT
jgi:protease I